MEKFKVGDKVRLNKNKAGYTFGRGYVKYDEIGTFKSFDGSHYTVDFPSHHDWKGSGNDCVLANLINSLGDLQFADILTLRNGERYVVTDGYMHGENSGYYCDCDELDDEYNDDLTRDGNKAHDIVKVERAGQVIFEREEVIEMTISEISEKLGYEVKVVKEK